MKKIKICILSCLSVFILTSCELNIVPDNIPTIEDHAFGCCTALTNIICLPV